MSHILLEWEALEYTKRSQGNDWFWAVSIIALSGATSAFIFKNPLLALLIIVATSTLLFYSKRDPKLITYKISDRGVVAGETLYPFDTIEQFWIEEHGRTTLLLKTDRLFMSITSIPVEGVETEAVRNALSEHAHEGPLRRSVFEYLLEYLGF